MHRLTRTVRLHINPAGTELGSPPRSGNTYAGFPTPVGFAAFCEVEVGVAGEPDPVTGYVLDIRVIDGATRRVLLPALNEAYRASPPVDVGRWLCEHAPALAAALPRPLRSLRLRLTPLLSYEVHMPPTATTLTTPTTVLLRQRFDFAASHRLHVPTMTDEENRALFGKCNNVHGHGHNYQIEPCVAISISSGGSGISVGQLEEVCSRVILARFDHKHLNEDTQEFNLARGGVNPSVENIARVFHDLLAPEVARTPGAHLRSITVWETDRTCATYPAA